MEKVEKLKVWDQRMDSEEYLVQSGRLPDIIHSEYGENETGNQDIGNFEKVEPVNAEPENLDDENMGDISGYNDEDEGSLMSSPSGIEVIEDNFRKIEKLEKNRILIFNGVKASKENRAGSEARRHVDEDQKNGQNLSKSQYSYEPKNRPKLRKTTERWQKGKPETEVEHSHHDLASAIDKISQKKFKILEKKYESLKADFDALKHKFDIYVKNEGSGQPSSFRSAPKRKKLSLEIPTQTASRMDFVGIVPDYYNNTAAAKAKGVSPWAVDRAFFTRSQKHSKFVNSPTFGLFQAQRGKNKTPSGFSNISLLNTSEKGLESSSRPLNRLFVNSTNTLLSNVLNSSKRLIGGSPDPQNLVETLKKRLKKFENFQSKLSDIIKTLCPEDPRYISRDLRTGKTSINLKQTWKFVKDVINEYIVSQKKCRKLRRMLMFKGIEITRQSINKGTREATDFENFEKSKNSLILDPPSQRLVSGTERLKRRPVHRRTGSFAGFKKFLHSKTRSSKFGSLVS